MHGQRGRVPPGWLPRLLGAIGGERGGKGVIVLVSTSGEPGGGGGREAGRIWEASLSHNPFTRVRHWVGDLPRRGLCPDRGGNDGKPTGLVRRRAMTHPAEQDGAAFLFGHRGGREGEGGTERRECSYGQGLYHGPKGYM